MWGFAADNAAGGLCRVYASAFGHFPASCLSGSGIPALAMTAIVLLAGFVLLQVLRSGWRQH